MMVAKKVIALCIALVFSVGILYPDRVSAMTIPKERELSLEFKKMALRHLSIIRDPLIVDYVNAVGQRILATLPPQPFTYQFYVIKDVSYNAFAGPGGLIFMHSGLFAAMESEEQLAGILSHEIAHGVHRHLADRADQARTVGLTTLAALAGGILLGVAGSGIPTDAVVIGAISAGQSLTLSYSREAEEQADRSGMRYLHSAGYSSDGLLQILGKMRKRQWHGPKEIPPYLSTHPALEERISYVGASPPQAAARSPKQPEGDDFRWAHTKLIAVYGEEEAALRRFEREIKEQPESAVSHYGYGLTLGRTDNLKEATAHIKYALGKAPLNPHILIDLGRIYFRNGQFEEAHRVLKDATSISPNNAEGLYFFGRTQLEIGEYKEAVNTLSTIVNHHEGIQKARYYLGEAYEKMGDMPKSHYNLGMYYKDIRNFKSALFHLERSAKTEHNPEEKQEIRKIIEEINKEIGKEQRGKQQSNRF